MSVTNLTGHNTVPPHSLDGRNQSGKLTPAPTFLFHYSLADAASGNINFALAQKVRVVDAWCVKKAADGHATEDTVVIGKGASAITDAMAIGANNDTSITRAATINDANMDLATTDNLRITWVKGSGGGNNVACDIYVVLMKLP